MKRDAFTPSACRTIHLNILFFKVCNEDQLTVDLEHVLDDHQLDTNMAVDEQGEDVVGNNLLSSGELFQIMSHIETYRRI